MLADGELAKNHNTKCTALEIKCWAHQSETSVIYGHGEYQTRPSCRLKSGHMTPLVQPMWRQWLTKALLLHSHPLKQRPLQQRWGGGGAGVRSQRAHVPGKTCPPERFFFFFFLTAGPRQDSVTTDASVKTNKSPLHVSQQVCCKSPEKPYKALSWTHKSLEQSCILSTRNQVCILKLILLSQLI